MWERSDIFIGYFFGGGDVQGGGRGNEKRVILIFVLPLNVFLAVPGPPLGSGLLMLVKKKKKNIWKKKK